MLSHERVETVCLVILSTIAVGASLFWLRPVLIPFILAVFVAVGLSPLVDLQIRALRLPRPVALFTTLVTVMLLLSSVGMIVSSSINELAEKMDTYVAQVSQMGTRLSALLPDPIKELVPPEELKTLTTIPASSIGRLLGQTTNAILSLVSQSFVVFVFVTFLLIGEGRWSRQATGTLGQLVSSVRRYLVVSVMISALTGALVGATLLLLGIPLATVFGLLAFILNFVPTVGSIIATLLPLPVLIISPEVSPSAAVLAVLIPSAIQAIIGNLVTPKVLGDALDLHPIVILMALIFWGMLWGVVGMLLAMPITAVLKILIARLPSTQPLSELMAGRIPGLDVEEADVSSS